MTRCGILLLVLICGEAAAPAAAHHSFAIFDRTKLLTLQGVARKVEYGNPHIFLFVEVPTADGHTKLWSIECGGVNYMNSLGWKVNTIKPGDAVTVIVNPLRDGQPGGTLQKMTLSNGAVIDLR